MPRLSRKRSVKRFSKNKSKSKRSNRKRVSKRRSIRKMRAGSLAAAQQCTKAGGRWHVGERGGRGNCYGANYRRKY